MVSAEELTNALKSVIGSNDEESTVRYWLDSGYPELNHAISSRWDGGFPVGRIVEVSGPPSSGKTAVATAAMAAAQRAGGLAGFFDHERSFSFDLAERLGLDTKSRFLFKKPRTFEESLTMAVDAAQTVRSKKLINKEAPICLVFDSLASMVPKSALFDNKGNEKSPEERTMHDNSALSRATSAAFPALSQHVEELNISAIFLNQIRTKIGVVYGDPRTTPGGDAPKFYASARIMLGAKQIKKSGEIIGMEITANMIKNKVSRPFKQATWRFMFEEDGSGRFDVERSTVDLLERLKVLKTGRPGFVEWEGKQIGKEALARQIQSDGSFSKLTALLPKVYDPGQVIVGADLDEDEAA